jgi:hypothetical protein
LSALQAAVAEIASVGLGDGLPLCVRSSHAGDGSYSLPALDIEAEKRLQRSLSTNERVDRKRNERDPTVNGGTVYGNSDTSASQTLSILKQLVAVTAP